jgi:hypothetical protein
MRGLIDCEDRRNSTLQIARRSLYRGVPVPLQSLAQAWRDPAAPDTEHPLKAPEKPSWDVVITNPPFGPQRSIGDILLPARPSTGRPTLLGQKGGTGNRESKAAFDAFVVRANPAVVNSEYLAKTIEMLRPKSATASPLTLSALMRIQVPLPSIEEQILIARLAGAIDYRLTISNSRRKLLEELLESVLKGIMSGHFRFPASQ